MKVQINKRKAFKNSSVGEKHLVTARRQVM